MTTELGAKTFRIAFGLIKLGLVAIAIFLFCYSFIPVEHEGGGAIHGPDPILLYQLAFVIVSPLPSYYLIRTGIWNLKGQAYSRAGIVLIGTIAFTVFTLFFMYLTLSFGIIALDFFGFCCVVMGIIDLVRIINGSPS